MTSAKSPQLRLRHMLDNIDGILAATAGMAPSDIAGSFVILRAVQRSVQIISALASRGVMITRPPAERRLE